MFEITSSIALMLIVCYVIIHDMSRRYTYQQIMKVTVTTLILFQIALAVMPRWLRMMLAVTAFVWLLIQAFR